jgi:endonuclease G
MDDSVRKKLDRLVRQRLEATRETRERSRLMVLRNDPLAAEPSRERAAAYARHAGAERKQGDTLDWVDAWFLGTGARKARAVAIVRDRNFTALGSAFLISPRLLITNNHVLETPWHAGNALIEFNFEEDEQRVVRPVTRFALDPERFWLASPDDQLDFSIVAVGERLSGEATVAEQGFLALSDRPDKHALGIAVNVIQHPLAGPKKVVVRENRLLARELEAESSLHYTADTDEGASGSPVFNDQWEVVALHHWAVPHLDKVSVNGVDIPLTVNEGVRVSKIVGKMRQSSDALADHMKPLLTEALALGGGGRSPQPARAPGRPPDGALRLGAEGLRQREEASMSSGTHIKTIVNVPLEITVRVGGGVLSGSAAGAAAAGLMAGAERMRRDRDYSNRNGFNPDFIDDAPVTLADLVRPREREVAPLLSNAHGVEAVLDYQNFSIVQCQGRRMAFVSACNVVGEAYLAIDRDTGEPFEGAEGETWYNDDRMDPAFYIGQDFYSGWSTYFDRGHLTRRTEPTWGTPAESMRANADTYHRTNCAPQHFRFNQSVRHWQGVERFILEHGVLKEKSRLTILSGPVLDDQNYSPCDDVNVPLLFWKVVLRTGQDGKPKASAFLVNQTKLLKEPRTFIARPDEEAAPKVDTFRYAIASLGGLTGLDFSALIPFDTYKSARGREGAEAAAKPMTDLVDAL